MSSYSFCRLFSIGVLIVAVLGLTGCGPRADDAHDIDVPVDTLRILAYNIHHGEGMDEVIDLERIAALIRDVDPDLVALQEVDSVVTRTNGVDQAAALGDLTGMQPIFGRFMSYQGGAYGMALLSRLPVISSQNLRLPDGDEPRTAVAATIELPSGRDVRLVGIHFYRTEAERLAQARSLEEHLASLDDLPTILAGDFNSTPDDSVMTHLRAGWHVVDKGEDRLTFSSFDPEKEIDYFLWQPESAFSLVGQQLLDEPVISDHRPLVLDVVVGDQR